MRWLVVLLLAGCGSSTGPHPQSDWERQNIRQQEWQEDAAVAPAYPRQDALLEFFVSVRSDFRFFVDGASINPGADGVVRFVLVARSPAGVENVTYEGIRCATGEYRRYAVGRADASWSGRPGAWQAIAGGGSQPWHRALQREYFCPQAVPIRDAAEGARALRDGGHPFAKGFDADSLRDRR
jgi:hypothetical protein